MLFGTDCIDVRVPKNLIGNWIIGNRIVVVGDTKEILGAGCGRGSKSEKEFSN